MKDQERQDFLEDLYGADGRHSKDHPMHGLYSGLFNRDRPSPLALEVHYRRWWAESYPMPPNKQAVERSVQWAQQLHEDFQ